MKTVPETSAASSPAKVPGALPASVSGSPDTLTVLFDGDSALCFVDISAASESGSASAAERDQLLARFHVQRADGSRLDGAAAFVAMWDRLPGLSPHLVRELRSDHAGETGAVQIYRGIDWVARLRHDDELLAFAKRHGAAEAEHLRLIEGWLPPAQRSRLLLPWRIAGWLTGALPALAGRRAVYATINAVETFVDRHYQEQIDHLHTHGGSEVLLALLLRCQADEQHHRDEAAALAAAPSDVGQPRTLRLWCALVASGSAAAVVLARRL